MMGIQAKTINNELGEPGKGFEANQHCVNEPVCETCGYPLTHFVDESGRGPQGFGCAMCDFGPDVYSEPESEYDRAKRHYEECLENLRTISHDFTPEGQRVFLKALEESRRAYTDLFWADRDRVATQVEQSKRGAQ